MEVRPEAARVGDINHTVGTHSHDVIPLPSSSDAEPRTAAAFKLMLFKLLNKTCERIISRTLTWRRRDLITQGKYIIKNVVLRFYQLDLLIQGFLRMVFILLKSLLLGVLLGPWRSRPCTGVNTL